MVKKASGKRSFPFVFPERCAFTRAVCMVLFGASAFVCARINATERQTDSFALIRHSVDDYVRDAKLNTWCFWEATAGALQCLELILRFIATSGAKLDPLTGKIRGQNNNKNIYFYVSDQWWYSEVHLLHRGCVQVFKTLTETKKSEQICST